MYTAVYLVFKKLNRCVTEKKNTVQHKNELKYTIQCEEITHETKLSEEGQDNSA